MVMPYGNVVSVIPALDKVVKYSDGMYGPVLFHYAREGADLKSFARAAGFDLAFVLMQEDEPDGPRLIERYNSGRHFERMMLVWRPTAPGPEWKLVGQSDSDDGPVAIFMRPTTMSRESII